MLFNALVAVVLSLSPLGQKATFASLFLTSQGIGLTIHALFLGVGHLLRLDMSGLPLPLRLAYVVTIVLAGSWVGYSLGMWVSLGDRSRLVDHLAGASGALLVIPALSAALTVMTFAAVNRLRAQQLMAEREQRARERAEREAIAARLALLNAQIEPHFLYNTLAHVSALLARDPGAAEQMLEDLIGYLRASSRNMGQLLVSLADELESVRGYLAVMQRRLRGRLTVRYVLDPSLAALRIPPASVQTLVENAIKHGIEPSPAGGEILVRSRARAGVALLEVVDTGKGLPAEGERGTGPETARPGEGAGPAGTGLANLRERLRLGLGQAASLTLEPGDLGRGCVATIAVPVPAAPDEPAPAGALGLA